MKNFLSTAFLCLIVVMNSLAQHNLEINANASQLRLNGELTYRLEVKKMTFSASFGYGQIARQRFDAGEKKDGYEGIYNTYDFSGNYKFIGFKHNFIGSTVGVGIGRKFIVSEKNSLLLTANINYLFLKDNYIHYYSSTATNGSEAEQKTIISRQTADIDLSVIYLRQLTENISLKTGVILPFILPTLTNEDKYQPLGGYLPAAGLEPYLTIGIQYKFLKKEKDEK